MSLENKVIITAALAGGATMKFQNPAVPYTPEEFAEEAHRVYESGGAIVHIHAKDPKTGLATPNIDQVTKTIQVPRLGASLTAPLRRGCRGRTIRSRQRDRSRSRPGARDSASRPGGPHGCGRAVPSAARSPR